MLHHHLKARTRWHRTRQHKHTPPRPLQHRIPAKSRTLPATHQRQRIKRPRQLIRHHLPDPHRLLLPVRTHHRHLEIRHHAPAFRPVLRLVRLRPHPQPDRRHSLHPAQRNRVPNPHRHRPRRHHFPAIPNRQHPATRRRRRHPDPPPRFRRQHRRPARFSNPLAQPPHLPVRPRRPLRRCRIPLPRKPRPVIVLIAVLRRIKERLELIVIGVRIRIVRMRVTLHTPERRRLPNRPRRVHPVMHRRRPPFLIIRPALRIVLRVPVKRRRQQVVRRRIV